MFLHENAVERRVKYEDIKQLLKASIWSYFTTTFAYVSNKH